MKVKNIAGLVAAAIVLIVVLFEVKFRMDASRPDDARRLDVAQEIRFTECYSLRDKKIHELAFGTIDNPDVQKEYINTHRERATADCRKAFPQQWLDVR